MDLHACFVLEECLILWWMKVFPTAFCVSKNKLSSWCISLCTYEPEGRRVYSKMSLHGSVQVCMGASQIITSEVERNGMVQFVSVAWDGVADWKMQENKFNHMFKRRRKEVQSSMYTMVPLLWKWKVCAYKTARERTSIPLIATSGEQGFAEGNFLNIILYWPNFFFTMICIPF